MNKTVIFGINLSLFIRMLWYFDFVMRHLDSQETLLGMFIKRKTLTIVILPRFQIPPFRLHTDRYDTEQSINSHQLYAYMMSNRLFKYNNDFFIEYSYIWKFHDELYNMVCDFMWDTTNIPCSVSNTYYQIIIELFRCKKPETYRYSLQHLWRSWGVLRSSLNHV